ncbi:NAD(P)/FAD-dependent oxidoreductase [Aquabacter spiritensis]|nr:TIGR03862 family flavoprotein [Aquabacter spiritensis]
MVEAISPVCVIGAGPAGLMAADRLTLAGLRVTLFERMPSPARKFLMAGRGGLNLTHSEPLDAFLARYGPAAPALAAAVRAFPPEALRAFAADLGEETFVGSSGRVFPKSFKASPLLRAWLRRLAARGVDLRVRHTFLGWSPSGALRFATPEGETEIAADACVLALGGASWPRLGGDGAWAAPLAARGVPVTPLAPANMGVHIHWSEAFRARFARAPLKRLAVRVGDKTARGEAVVTEQGLEGGAIYAVSAALRAALARGPAELVVDLRPDLSRADLAGRLASVPPKHSLANRLRKGGGLSPAAAGLLREALDRPGTDPDTLAGTIKAARFAVAGTGGLERAISSAGGLAFEGLDADFRVRGLPVSYPVTFACGEMLDWEAPTGGYLLQACFATGRAAAEGVLRRLADGSAGKSAL